MKKKRLGLVHTSATLVPVFKQLCSEQMPEVETFNIVDDSLIAETIRNGKLSPETSWRVATYVQSAARAGADFILVTCSSIGAAVEASAPLVNVPVLRVDQPMADTAVAKGKRIGVVATLSTTLEPTADLVRRRALAVGKSVEITAHLCEGAFEALMGGNPQAHDEKVAAALEKLSATSDVIVLAQASMARVVATLPAKADRPPILASPPTAIARIRELLG